MQKINFFWFRRDLRLEDNAGLYHALKTKLPVQCIFIFDRNILDSLPKDDARVTFIHHTITELQEQLKQLGSSLLVKYGKPIEVWEEIAKTYSIDTIFTNRDYEPYATQREAALQAALPNIKIQTSKDHVIFEGTEVLKDDGKPYTVFTPYKKKWLARLHSKVNNNLSYYFQPYPTQKYYKNLNPSTNYNVPSLSDMGFETSKISLPSKTVKQSIIMEYTDKRNFPAIDGTTKLGLHFRFGTISIREKGYKAQQLNETYLSELVWRDFYSQIMYHFPQVVGQSFRPEYDRIQWVNNPDDFVAWQNGMTGYPIVDAGMRELKTTGHMHNRVRMIVASFLTKHLLIDWRWGEAHFAEHLLDFDLASNNGGWQWAAGCGTDAAPYFRIFSPDAQVEKFDKQLVYIKKWVPELNTPKYPKPIVDHKYARERCLSTYKMGLGKG
jgi:deoxyribodipyrimidine photo-lyase